MKDTGKGLRYFDVRISSVLDYMDEASK